MASDPIHQFEIHKLFTLGHIGGHEIAVTNSTVYMFAAVGVVSLLMIGGSAGKQLIPNRFQSMAELSYEFVADMLRSNAGEEGMKFFPLVFTLFMFIAVGEPDRHHPLHIHRHQPPDRHGVHGADRLHDDDRLRLLQARLEFPQTVRPARHPGLHPAAGRLHRGAVVLPEAGVALGASVRQHARRPHRAEGVRGLRHHAWRAWASSAGSARSCRWG